MILWNAIWKNHTGIFFTNTIPWIRVIIRMIVTNDTKGAFDTPINESQSIYDDDDDDDVWVIRRKPSNPDYKQSGNFAWPFSLFGF